MSNEVLLRELTENDELAFLQGALEWEGEPLYWHSFDWKPGVNYLVHLDRLEKNKLGLDLDPRFVPSTMLYGFLGNIIVGRVSVRHQLNENLLKRGGHIGYAVAPRFRKQGYATQMVTQSLSYCKGLGIEKLLITCATTNMGSCRIIENLGGQLEGEVFDDEDQENIFKYWLELK